ncbi:MAG: 2-C-methyl-D-erythritol 4-phosphate cytidylyltransferase [Reichenbachiella sp.]
MKKHVIIVAGGSGSRMKADIPKQFLTLLEYPILMHTIKEFYSNDSSINIVLVLPVTQFDYWQKLISKHSFDIEHSVVKGGDTRFASVRNGLESIDGNGLVAIHDGARPLVSQTIITTTFNQAAINGNAIASVALKDSIRQTTKTNNWMVNRKDYRIIQTPQTFDIELIKKAFKNANPSRQYTDDASVLEDLNMKVYLVEGDYENIKITTPEDIIMAEAILNSRQ